MQEPYGKIEGLTADCSALSWRTADGKHLWGRNFDSDRLPENSRVTFVPKGTVYRISDWETSRCAAYAALGIGLPTWPDRPILYEGINQMGLMGGQLLYREFAKYPSASRPGTQPLQPPLAVYHVLAQCADVEQAATLLEKDVTLVGEPLWGMVPPLHWAFSDRSGETLVVEPDATGLHLHRNTLGVLTNSPGYPWHRLHLLNFAGLRDLDHDAPDWDGQVIPACFSGSGAQGLPGDWSAPARFVRLCFLKRYAVPGRNEEQGVMRMLRLFESAAFPLGAVRLAEGGFPAAPDRLPVYDYTLYTSVMCAESLRFYWTTYENPQVQYIDLGGLQDRTQPLHWPLSTHPDLICRAADGAVP